MPNFDDIFINNENDCYSDIVVVLCLAGLGKRFLNEGYTTPKFLLPYKANKNSILEEIIKNFILSGVREFFLVFNNRDKKWKKVIFEICENLKVNFHIDFIDDSKGQAETAFIATQIIKDGIHSLEMSKKTIAFHNGDTILKNRNFKKIKTTIKNDVVGVIDSFNSKSKNFSYISIDNKDYVKEIVEKKIISNRATSGLYIFSNYITYRTFYKKIDFSKKELFISDVYTQVLKSKSKVINIHNQDSKDTIILGTPLEYEEWINK